MEDSNQRPILSLYALAALRQLIQVLPSPKSDQQEQQILQILQTHPILLPAFIRHRQQQDQSGGAEADANMPGQAHSSSGSGLRAQQATGIRLIRLT